MNNKYFKIFLLNLSLLLVIITIQLFVESRHSFISDPLVKSLQIDSIRKNKFIKQEILYSEKDIDPDLKIHPYHEGFIFYNKDRIIGQYPVAYTYLYSLIPLPIHLLIYLNSVFIFLMVILFLHLYKEFNGYKIILISLFLSVFISLILDLSEYPLFLTLAGIGFFLINKYIQTYDSLKLILLGSFFLGFSAWLRLESLILAFCIYISILIYPICVKKNNPTILRYTIYGMLMFSLIVSSFFYFNLENYGHFLGPRYILNVEKSSNSLMQKAILFLSINFTYLRGGVPSIGFFFFSPLFLIVSIKALIKWKLVNDSIKINLLIASSYLLIVGFTAPNDGITITGRYSVLAVFPFCIVLLHYYRENKVKILDKVAIAWSIFLLIATILIFKVAFKDLKKYNQYFTGLDADAYLTTNEMLSGGFGLSNLNRKVYSIRNKNNLSILSKILNKNSYNSIYVISYSDEFKGYSDKNLLDSDILLNRLILENLNSLKYNCNKESSQLPINVSFCEKENR